ncbi:MAG: hypothetical protein AAGH40_05075 [Verrucomicrobiota bacterium]
MKYASLLIFLFLAGVQGSSAESIFESLREAETDFQITFNNEPVAILEQGITLRAVKETINVKNRGSELVSNSIAYQAYHLEFAFKSQFKRSDYSQMEFYQGNDLIHSMHIWGSHPISRRITVHNIDRFESNYLGINLEGISLVILDSVDRINFK